MSEVSCSVNEFSRSSASCVTAARMIKGGYRRFGVVFSCEIVACMIKWDLSQKLPSYGLAKLT